MDEQRHEQRPELIDDRTIEAMIRAARVLVLVIYVVVLMTFAILALGFFLRLAGASGEATFVDWAYRNSERAMQPFRGMFPVERIDDRSVFDPSLLFAAAFYGFFAIGLHAVVNYLTDLTRFGRNGRNRDRQQGSTMAGQRPSAGSSVARPEAVTGTTADDTHEFSVASDQETAAIADGDAAAEHRGR